MLNRVTHLQRPKTDLTACGENGPFLFKTYDTDKVTCAKCRKRAPRRMHAPDPSDKTPGRVVQPGGGRRR